MTLYKSLFTVSVGAILAAGCQASAPSGETTKLASEVTEGAVASYNATRVAITSERQKISANWQYLENATRDPQSANDMSAWESVDLPHTWNADDTTDIVTGYRRDGSWYRKQIEMSHSRARR